MPGTMNDCTSDHDLATAARPPVFGLQQALLLAPMLCAVQMHVRSMEEIPPKFPGGGGVWCRDQRCTGGSMEALYWHHLSGVVLAAHAAERPPHACGVASASTSGGLVFPRTEW